MPAPAAGRAQGKRGQYRGPHRGGGIRDDDNPKTAKCVHCGRTFPFEKSCTCELATKK